MKLVTPKVEPDPTSGKQAESSSEVHQSYLSATVGSSTPLERPVN